MKKTALTPRNRKPDHQIAPEKEWLAARMALLKKEKEATRLMDEVAAERRKLPWTKVTKKYVFDSTDGKIPLADLFDGRTQLVIQHFMLGVDWDEGCPSCSYMADHTDAMIPHLAARDTTMIAVSHAQLSRIAAFKKRMGWHFNWVSSFKSDFNFDFHVSFTEKELAKGKVHYNYVDQEFPCAEAPGLSVFYKDAEGTVYHTYSTYGRGVEVQMGTYRILDITPKGRDEKPGHGMDWVRHHDRYGNAKSSCCCEEKH